MEADIATLDLDAIVNAANGTLLGGGDVDGAIHRAAGPGLLATCRALPETSRGVRFPTGEARITPGFRLPARQVILTVAPLWAGATRAQPTCSPRANANPCASRASMRLAESCLP